MSAYKSYSVIFTSIIYLIFLFFIGCDTEPSSPALPTINNPSFQQNPEMTSTDTSVLRVWEWENITIPSYTYPDATAFGDGLFVDVAFDTLGVFIRDDHMYFHLDPESPITPDSSISPNNYRSEIHTMPWNIEHPLGTEQWMGWKYIFCESYVIDPSSPITIFQNHPGIIGMSPAIELEIAREGQVIGALGGEIQIINAPNNTRYLTDFRPVAGDTLDIVIQVVHDLGSNGYFRVWFNDELVHEEVASTVYDGYEFGGNNKWGVYHHNFNDDPTEVVSSLDAGAGLVELAMGTLRLLTRGSDHFEYRTNAFDLVTPNQ
ncbi:MAG: heparin lyase I family protein [Bacteroidota bacterium]